MTVLRKIFSILFQFLLPRQTRQRRPSINADCPEHVNERPRRTVGRRRTNSGEKLRETAAAFDAARCVGNGPLLLRRDFTA